MPHTALPCHASVVVIGGGVMGCSTLYHLAKAGVSDAVLLERNQLTSGTTWHSAAQVRALRSSRNLTDLIRYSISLYAGLEEETGQATGWIGKGSLSVATTEDRLVHIRRQEALAHLFGVRARSIPTGEAKERWPLMRAEDVIGAVWSPDDGRVGPSDLCAALVKGARARGARIYEDTGVTGILTGGGRITGVETDRGAVRCDAIALCAGLWSRKVASMAGAEVPVWPCEHFYLLTQPIDGIEGNLPTLSDHDGHLYVRDDSGGLLIGCFEPIGKAIDPERLGEDFAFRLLPEDWDHFEPMMLNALHRLPALETAQVKMLLNGPESFTPDGAFLLGEAAETRGLFLGCGMNSVGVASAGGAGMALAHCIVHGQGTAPATLHAKRLRRLGMRQLPGGHVEGVDGSQRIVGGGCGMQRLVHDQRIGEVRFPVALADPDGSGVPERPQSAPYDLIVLEADVRLAEQAFDRGYDVRLAQTVFTTGKRPHRLHQHHVRDQHRFISVDDGVRPNRLRLVVPQQVPEQNVRIDTDQGSSRSRAL